MQPQYDAAGAHAWDMKHLVRTIVTSQTYKQSSAPRPELEARDPGNRLLARQMPLRVDAEVVHDVALQVSGLLVEKFGGRSVRPYQPDGYLAALNYPRRSYSADRGDDLYRRAHLHALAADVSPSVAGGVRCAVARGVRARAGALRHAAAVARPAERSDLRRGRPRVRGGRAATGWHDLERASSTGRLSRALGRPPDAEELRTLSTLHARQPGAVSRRIPARRGKLIRTGEYPVPADIAPVSTGGDDDGDAGRAEPARADYEELTALVGQPFRRMRQAEGLHYDARSATTRCS